VREARLPAVAAESLVTRFERVAVARHSHTALVSDCWQPSYEELNLSANRLAHALIARGGAAEDCIAILMRYDSPLIAALFAVLKAARMAVLLRSANPVDQLRRVVADVGASLILTDSSHRQLAAEIAGESRGVMQFEDFAFRGSQHNPDIRISPEATAVLSYSSGSTGRPNAVMLTHRQILQHIARVSCGLEIVPDDRIAHFAAIDTTSAVLSTLLAPINGATLCPFAVQEKGMGGLGDWLDQREITVFISSAPFFRNFAKTLAATRQLRRMRAVRVGSESATSEDFAAFEKHFPPGCLFVHSFNCSEVGTIAQLRLSHGDPVPKGRLPAGRPFDDIEVAVEDVQGNKVGPGEIGQITVRGSALAAGYWRDPALMAARFSQGPPGSGVRIYRGGDLGRFNADGLLEFVGRQDAQVKVRGFRVMLTDVEDAVRRVPAVENAAVCGIEQADGAVRIVGYVVPACDQWTSVTALKRALRTALPDHMIPSSFIVLDRMPLTANGKIDRQKLRQMKFSDGGDGSSKLPQAPTEQMLAEIWAEELGLPNVGRDDDFFALGGDSLRAAVVQARVEDIFRVKLDLGVFADHPTLAALASVVDEARGPSAMEAVPPLVRVARSEPLPLSTFQERVWVYAQTADPRELSCPVAHRLAGPLDPAILAECLRRVINSHEILRTTYAVVQGRTVQIPNSAPDVPVTFTDLSHSADADERAAQLLDRLTAEAFDLEKGPMAGFSIIRLREHEHWLLRSAHHIACDGWSWSVFMREVVQLYAAMRRGEAPVLPASERLQYADYAIWQRDRLHRGRPEFEQIVAWWKERLADPPLAPRLPFRRPNRVDGLDPNEGSIEIEMHPRVSRRLARLARENGATFYMARLAAFVVLLSSMSGQSDVLIGTHVANRNRPALRDIFGYFANLIPLRFFVEPSMSFRQWLQVVRRRVWMAEARGELSYGGLVSELVQAGLKTPDIQQVFHVSFNDSVVDFAGLTMTRLVPRLNSMPPSFSLNVNQQSDRCLVRFDAGIYDPGGVRAFALRYLRLLDAASRDVDMPLSALLEISAPALSTAFGAPCSADSRTVPLK